MIELVNNIACYEEKQDRTADEERNLAEAKTRGYNYLKQLMNNVIANCLRKLIIFSYYLRLEDHDDDRYTIKFLDLIKPDNLSPILKKIIMANRKDKEGQALVWSSQSKYKLMCGKDFEFVVKYKDG